MNINQESKCIFISFFYVFVAPPMAVGHVGHTWTVYTCNVKLHMKFMQTISVVQTACPAMTLSSALIIPPPQVLSDVTMLLIVMT